MLVKLKFNTEIDLLDFIRGTTVLEARTGENAAANSTFTDATTGAFADVEVGDEVHISGDATVHAVTSKTNDNSIEVAPSIAAQHAGPGSFATYRILRDANDIADFAYGPVADPTQNGVTWGIYDLVNFG